MTLGVPLASLLRITRDGAWLPTLSYAMQQMHQFGAGIPTGGSFTASEIPDQFTVVQDASAQWQVKQWQLAYRVNLSDQDNRQSGRELADFATQTHAVTIGVTMGSTLTLGLDLGLERQHCNQRPEGRCHGERAARHRSSCGNTDGQYDGPEESGQRAWGYDASAVRHDLELHARRANQFGVLSWRQRKHRLHRRREQQLRNHRSAASFHRACASLPRS